MSQKDYTPALYCQTCGTPVSDHPDAATDTAIDEFLIAVGIFTVFIGLVMAAGYLVAKFSTLPTTLPALLQRVLA